MTRNVQGKSVERGDLITHRYFKNEHNGDEVKVPWLTHAGEPTCPGPWLVLELTRVTALFGQKLHHLTVLDSSGRKVEVVIVHEAWYEVER